MTDIYDVNTPEPRTEKTLYSVEPISVRADHHDPLRDIGDWPRVLCGWVIAVVRCCSLACRLLPYCDYRACFSGRLANCGRAGDNYIDVRPAFRRTLFWLARDCFGAVIPPTASTVLPLWLIQVMGVVDIAGSPLWHTYQLSTRSFRSNRRSFGKSL